MTPLMYACINRNLKIVKYLIKNGADVNMQEYKENTALMYASIFGSIEIVEYLLVNGAKTGIQNIGGTTACMFAYKYGNNDIVKLLRKKKNPKLINGYYIKKY